MTEVTGERGGRYDIIVSDNIHFQRPHENAKAAFSDFPTLGLKKNTSFPVPTFSLEKDPTRCSDTHKEVEIV